MSSNLFSIETTLLPKKNVYKLASYLGNYFKYVTLQANKYATPAELPLNTIFKTAIVPGTITQLLGQSLESAHLDAVNLDAVNLDAANVDAANLNQYDHWLKVEFKVDLDGLIEMPATLLQLEGLLTHADIFLNDVLILQSRNAFHTHTIDVTKQLKITNQLYICFRAIAPLLTQKQPRARFSTRLINQRHLRFIRTVSLGYMPGFADNAKLVGAFRPIKLISQSPFMLTSSKVNTVLSDNNIGKISVSIQLLALEKTPESAYLVLVDEASEKLVARAKVSITANEKVYVIHADFEADNIDAYWPHTHGTPKRYLLKLLLKMQNIESEITLGRFGFRNITQANNDYLALQINHCPLFLRGACWTPMNPLSLQTSPQDMRQRLMMLQQAGINMLRLPGNMPYECDDFYEMCDKLGILIMQDFAFSNFDYPEDNEDFIENVKSEARTFLAKHGNRACLTLLAGNSEVSQQAAMMGIDLNDINNIIFDDVLKKICAEYAPNVPYVNSSPNSQEVPFHAGNGTSHYYGVGGYKRGFEDARLFKGQFIAECLALSNVPENTSLLKFYDNEFVPTHHPKWKEGVPRDNGSGWDFADITDFYIEKLFNINVINLRATEPQRYLDYCRATSCEVVERTMNILRAGSTQGRAALVWYLHDLKVGAGWGYIDSLGKPKSAFYGLARASQQTTALFIDEGLEGLAVYLAHDGASLLDCQLEIALITTNGNVLEKQIKPCQLAARVTQRISVDAFLG